MAKELTPGKVFVPGGMPELTYVARANHALENSISQARDNLCKLVTLTGPTKSGKTVLARKVFPRNGASIWIDGGACPDEDSFWRSILYHLKGTETVEMSRSQGGQQRAAAKVGSDILGGSLEVGGDRGSNEQVVLKSNIPPRTLALNLLNESRTPLIVDDFHYLDKDTQRAVVRALKQPIFDGLPVVFIAIPNRRYDAERVEGEMRLRIESVRVPEWSLDELLEIPRKGFPLLNLTLPDNVTHTFTQECFGSPHLMQEFCRRIALDILCENKLCASDTMRFKSRELFAQCAEGTGRTVFDRLVRGPSERTDRLQRPLVGGGEADIYQVVLLALAKLTPGLGPVDYEDLRQHIRDALIEYVPQKHEVTRVLEKMAGIMSGEDNSVAVIDWDEDNRQLYVTDPFFAFFLKWGSIPSLIKK